MRIEYINTVTQKSGGVNVSPDKNPVRIGQHLNNDVVLDSPYVGAEALVLEHDVTGKDGWRIWNRNGHHIRVGNVLLYERNHVTPLPASPAKIVVHPYVLTITVSETSEANDNRNTHRKDQASADLIQQIHSHLVDLHPDDSADRAQWETDTYIHQLEQEIIEITSRRNDFPSDDTTATELGNHLAGISVRSLLLSRIDLKPNETKLNKRESAWTRARTAIPGLELDHLRLCENARKALKLEEIEDLTARVQAVNAGFWNWWQEALEERKQVNPRQCRYLALQRLIKEIKDVWYGFGPLEELLDDTHVNEIMVVGKDRIFVEKNKAIEDTGRRFFTDPMTIVQRLVGRANREVHTSQPMVDARMPDGSRVNVVIDPLALNGPFITIRRFPPDRDDIHKLVKDYKSLTPAARDFLEAVVKNQRNVIVSGGTGTGKTTMLNCLSGFIPDKQRIVTVEDTAELQLKKQHVLTLQTRQGNQEGAGIVTIRDLVRNALRMRPDRIVVGECRGGEAIDMLQAMNTGHDGSMTTLHANSPEGVVRRLEVLVQQNADSTLPVESIHAQIASAVDIIVQLGTIESLGKKMKVVTEIAEVCDVKPGGVKLVSLFKRGLDGELRATGSLPSFLPDLIATGHVKSTVDFVRQAMARN